MAKPTSAYRKIKPAKLHNELDLERLKQQLAEETVPRKTLSFYQYKLIEDPKIFRDQIFDKWNHLKVLGRVYLAKEGINAQISVPENRYEEFAEHLNELFPKIPLKFALEEAESFYKLIVKVRKKILADGLDDQSFDVTQVGRHLTAKEFNEAMQSEDTVVVDVRNHYESEIGHFEKALLPDVDSFREELPVIKDMLQGREDKKILLYCTGGIRCEKASAWLKHEGFKDVNQLHGGIIDYARQVKEQALENKFVGKNFVFDARLGERVSDEIIASCHQCGRPADTHTNCAWEACHILFIQCEACATKMSGCCSDPCKANTELPKEEQDALRKSLGDPVPGFFRSRRRLDTESQSL
jgi:UPF0176 protein